jgi:hypothetical protein
MDLDRGALAKLDRRILSGLDHDEQSQMVRVPVSEAVWSTWRHYCKAVGVAMGRGVAGLIANELGAVEGSTSGGGAAFIGGLQRRLVARAEELDVRERRLDDRERSLRASAAGSGHSIRVVSPREGRPKRAVPVRFGLQVQTMPRHLTRMPSHAYAPRMVAEPRSFRVDYRCVRDWPDMGGSRLENPCSGFGSYPSMSDGGCHVRTENPSAGSSANDGCAPPVN